MRSHQFVHISDLPASAASSSGSFTVVGETAHDMRDRAQAQPMRALLRFVRCTQGTLANENVVNKCDDGQLQGLSQATANAPRTNLDDPDMFDSAEEDE